MVWCSCDDHSTPVQRQLVSGWCKGSVKRKSSPSAAPRCRVRLLPGNRRETDMQNRVLLVEDDDELRQLLAQYLATQGFSVREAANGRDGLALALAQDCDIVVLDIMLPDINGLDVLRELRAETHLPVILLTARGDETDRIVGFEVGADDYIPKPCKPRELVARLQALLRRIRSEERRVGKECRSPWSRYQERK